MKYDGSKPSVFYLFIIPSGLKFTVNGHCREALCSACVLVSCSPGLWRLHSSAFFPGGIIKKKKRLSYLNSLSPGNQSRLIHLLKLPPVSSPRVLCLYRLAEEEVYVVREGARVSSKKQMAVCEEAVTKRRNKFSNGLSLSWGGKKMRK